MRVRLPRSTRPLLVAAVVVAGLLGLAWIAFHRVPGPPPGTPGPRVPAETRGLAGPGGPEVAAIEALEVRAVDACGSPVAGARVIAEREDAGPLEATGGEDGLARLAPLAAGAWTVTARADGHAAAFDTAEIVPGAARAPLVLVLSRGYALGSLFPPRATTLDRGHGRVERRTIQLTDELLGQTASPYLSGAFRIERHVTALDGTQARTEVVLGVTSRPVPARAEARSLGWVQRREVRARHLLLDGPEPLPGAGRVTSLAELLRRCQCEVGCPRPACAWLGRGQGCFGA